MKKTKILLLLAAVFTLSLTYTSCEEIKDEKQSENSNSSSAYLPIDFANKTVAAWYMLTDQDNSKTKIEAVFLFTDNSLVVTKVKFYSEADGRKPEYGISAIGRYNIKEGDYTDGKAGVITSDGHSFDVRIEKGKMYVPMGEDGEDIVFTKMSNSLLPKAYDPDSGGQGQGGDVNGDDLQAFFPTAYVDKTVSAWYSHSGSISEQGFDIKYVTSIYFFGDNTYATTSNIITKGPNGEVVERIISQVGKYRLEGSFTNGKLTLIYDENRSLTLEIKDGQFKVADTETGEYIVYGKQDNSKVPQPSEPTKNGNQGGNNNQGGDNPDSDVPAFFPTAFAGKTVVAWYSYTDSNPYQTMVEAVFLFDDNTLVVTEHKVFPTEIQETPERYILATGTYTLTGDYDNGSATVILVPERKISIYINDSKLTTELTHFTYTRRELKDVPSPLDPTDNGGNQGGEGGEENSNLAAWYSGTITSEGKEYTVDIILLDDNTVAFTQTRTPDGSGYQYMTEIIGVGEYKIVSGDLTNGTIMIVMFGEPKSFTVSNGMVTVMQDGQTVTYYKQDNSKYNGPTDFSDYDDDDDEGEEYDESLLKAYMPSDFADKTVAAWYMCADEDGNSGSIEAVFLFANNTLIVTKTKVYSKSDGRDPEYRINATGQYRITEGDFTTGKASVITADGNSFEVVISSGILTAMETEFTLMPNEYISILTTNGK